MQRCACRCETQTKTEGSALAHTYEDERAHAHGTALPTALIKACVISEVAAMKSLAQGSFI